MGTFCYDQYEHPLLWCDEKKKFVEKKNADESMMQWRQKRIEEKTKQQRDKLEYTDLSQKHCPWGKPGGGAPNVDVRRHDITVEGLHSTPGTKIIPGLRSYPSSRRPSIPRGHYLGGCDPPPHGLGSGQKRGSGISGIGPTSPYNTTNLGNISISRELGGGGAGRTDSSQIRSAAERLFITLKDQPNSKGKPHVDIELRYKTTPTGNKMLDKIVVTEQECPGTKKKSRENPWGRPGPGGKPWRSQSKVGHDFLHSMGWTSEQMLRDMDDVKNGLRTRSTGAKPKLKKKRSRGDEVLKSCCELCVCKCPVKVERSGSKNGVRTSAGVNVTTKADLKREIQKDLELEKEKIDFHTTGSGLSKVHQKPPPKVCPRYEGTLTTPSSNVELVPLLARRRGANRPISLSSTDVTKRTVENSTPFALDITRDLNNQVIEKRQNRTLHRLAERQACSDHFQTLDTYWGRPGYGAPKGVVRKLNLDELLWSGGE
ncbi:uncharacterized protein LOC129618490 [Condylostylus longicornis]|uniref:uncharacterized protein LOC129618490 n=1 Tax=Condylostylus longicornis TaxID=2530218 RepID=UPI00244DBFF2|nr:uncharacterized protein LOC129618490 [Condylostylus longicornis]